MPAALDVSATVDDLAGGPVTTLGTGVGTTTLRSGASTTTTLARESVGTETLDVTVTATRPGFSALVTRQVDVS